MYSQMISMPVWVTLRQLYSITASLVLLLAVSTSVSAQTARKDAPECSTVVEGLHPGMASASLMHGLVNVDRCPERGPVALARIWEAPPSDTAALETLGNVTLSVRDVRVIPAIVKTLDNSSMPRSIRLAALGTLVRLYSPDHVVQFKQRQGKNTTDQIYVLMGEWSHPVGDDGASPITQVDRDRLLAVITRCSQSNSDPGIRSAASQVLVRLGVGTR